jgi:hypothetical protein
MKGGGGSQPVVLGFRQRFCTHPFFLSFLFLSPLAFCTVNYTKSKWVSRVQTDLKGYFQLMSKGSVKLLHTFLRYERKNTFNIALNQRPLVICMPVIRSYANMPMNKCIFIASSHGLFFTWREEKFTVLIHFLCTGFEFISVRYHCGGSMELNARILLLAYMVYL